MRLDHLLSKEFCFGTAREPLRIRLKIFGSVLFGKGGDGVLRAWHAVGVLEQRSGPDPTVTDGHWFVVVCLVWVCWL